MLAACDGAKRLNGTHVAVPLTLRNSQILKHLGHPAMSPIEQDYDFPSRFAGPRPNQRVSAAFKTLHPRCMDISDMRTGKTLATLWAADWLLSQGVVHRCLIISPLSTLKRVWEDEIATSFHGRRTATVLYGTREQRIELLKRQTDYYIVNVDGIGVGKKHEGHALRLGRFALDIIERKDIDLIVIDEASAFKNASTDRWKILNRIIEAKPDVWVWALTGTPAANAPTDAHAIARLVYGKHRKPESFHNFRMRTMYRISEFKWVAQPSAPDAVFQLLQPAVRFTRKELGFPPLSFETRDVPLSKKQVDAYKAMAKDLELHMHDGTRIDAVNEAVLRGKLIQISCGAMYGPDHEVFHVDAAPRLAALDDIIEEAGGKILVFAPLTSVVDMIIMHIKRTVTCEKVTGQVASGARNKIFAAFCNTSSPRVIVADPRTMAHGLNLSVASTIVWFGPIDSLEIYEQSNARIDGPGQAGVVIHLASSPVEKEIYRRLQEKQALQGAILELLRGG